MDNKMKEELVAKAKAAKNAEEIKSISKENGYEMSDEEANAYFEQFHKTGELSDEELDSVSGGGCHTKDGRLVVTLGAFPCTLERHLWKCKKCGTYKTNYEVGCEGCHATPHCDNCAFCTYERGLWLCNNEKMRG